MTTCSTAGPTPFRRNRFLHLLLLGSAAAIGLSLYQPAMIVDWLLENLLVLVMFLALAFSYRRLPLSDLSYLLIFFFLCAHEWGANHKYADVPLGEWMKVWLATDRNHYDRVMHFVFGLFLAYPVQEIFLRTGGRANAWSYWIPVEASLAFGALYEMLEWIVASIVSPNAGEAFVGMQGDMWDAQKDLALGAVGAVIAMALVFLLRRLR